MVSLPVPVVLVNVTEVGKVMEYVLLLSPLTVNEAAVGEVAFGFVTPPVAVIVPAGANTAVPLEAVTAKLPKFMSAVFEMLMGVMIVAVAVAVAEACAFDLLAAKRTADANRSLDNFVFMSVDLNENFK